MDLRLLVCSKNNVFFCLACWWNEQYIKVCYLWSGWPFIHLFISLHIHAYKHTYLGLCFMIIAYEARKMQTQTSFSINLRCWITLSSASTQFSTPTAAWEASWMMAKCSVVGTTTGAAIAWRTGADTICRAGTIDAPPSTPKRSIKSSRWKYWQPPTFD